MRAGANGDQVVDRTAEVFFIGKNGNRAGSASLVTTSNISRRKIGANWPK